MKHHLFLTELKLFAMLFVFMVPLCSCSSTYPVRYTTNGELNEELTGQHATIEMQDGKEIFAKEVKIYNDSASWIDAGTNEESKLGMEKVKRIVVVKKDRVFGALKGSALGALAGVGVGWLSTSGESEGYKREYTAVAEFGYGAIGAGVGLIIGALVGHPENYEFQLTEGSDSRRKTHIEETSAKTDMHKTESQGGSGNVESL